VCVCVYIYIHHWGFKNNEDFVVFDGSRVQVFEDVFVFDTIHVYIPCKNLHI
jgi:hypothetical protein